MLGREGKLEASRRSSVEPGSCFSRYVRRMIIEDQLDRGAGRISGVETLEEFDELLGCGGGLDRSSWTFPVSRLIRAIRLSVP